MDKRKPSKAELAQTKLIKRKVIELKGDQEQPEQTDFKFSDFVDRFTPVDKKREAKLFTKVKAKF
jgi:hypothetical protein